MMRYFPTAVLVLLLAVSGCTWPDPDRDEVTHAEAGSFVLPDSVLFWEHVAPVAAVRCTPCHRENGAGPFPLRAYADFKKRLKTVRAVVADDYMPPWPADPTYSRFKDEKFLTPREKALFMKWFDAEGPEGHAPAGGLIDLEEAEIPEPDMRLLFPDTVHIRGSMRDRFYLAKIGFELPQDTVLAAVGFAPGNRQAVHHVNGHLINYNPRLKNDPGDGSWIENAETRTSLSAYEDMRISHDDGSYPPMRVSAFNYLPGTEPVRYPEGIGTVHISRKGAFLLNTLHYGPAPKDTFDLSEIHLWFAAEKPERPLLELHLGTQGETPVEPEFVIPAGEVKTFTTRYRTKEDISVLTVNPHMHLLGKSFKAYAASPDRRDTIPLVRIPEWDFRWQYFYTFRKMLKIPKGYEIIAVAEFDNTFDNPFNPNTPPKTMRAAGRNMKTTDEMFQFFVNFVPYRAGDENIRL